MANASTAFGFRQTGQLPGGPATFEMRVRSIQATNATPISQGDPVVRAGPASPYISNATTGSVTATTALQGIFVGCRFIPKTGGGAVESNSWPGSASSSDAVAFVIDNPEAQFLVSSIGSAITSASVGLNVNYAINSLSAGISTNNFSAAQISSAFLPTGISSFVVDGASVSTSSTLPFKIVGLYGPSFGNTSNNAPGNFGAVGNGSDPTTLFNWVIVSFNQQAFTAGQTGG